MNEERFRLMLRSPLWPDTAQNLPVAVRMLYTVMGRAGKMWQTILPATEDIHVARQTMDAANLAKRFDRIVITQGNTANRQASAWTTIECALPGAQLHPAMYTTLRGLQGAAANTNVAKQSQNFLLALACVFGTLLHSPEALGFIASLAVIDCLYLADTTPLRPRAICRLNAQRNWAYSTLNGCLLLLVLLKTLPL